MVAGIHRYVAATVCDHNEFRIERLGWMRRTLIIGFLPQLHCGRADGLPPSATPLGRRPAFLHTRASRHFSPFPCAEESLGEERAGKSQTVRMRSSGAGRTHGGPPGTRGHSPQPPHTQGSQRHLAPSVTNKWTKRDTYFAPSCLLLKFGDETLRYVTARR